MAKTLQTEDLFITHRPDLVTGLDLETTILGEILVKYGLIDTVQHGSIRVVIKLLSYFSIKTIILFA